VSLNRLGDDRSGQDDSGRALLISGGVRAGSSVLSDGNDNGNLVGGLDSGCLGLRVSDRVCARRTNNGVSCVVNGVRGGRDTLRGLLGTLGGLDKSLGQSGGGSLGQGLAVRGCNVGHRAGSDSCVDFLSLGGSTRNGPSGLHATTLAAGDSQSASGGVCVSESTLSGGDRAQSCGGVHGLSACDVGRLGRRRRNPGRCRVSLSRLGTTSLAAGDSQSRGQSSGLCVGLAITPSSVSCRANSGGGVGGEGRGSVVLISGS
jgi:hypothetical protein